MLGDSATTTLSGDTASETAHRHDVVGSVSVSVSGAGEENSGEEDIRIGREEGERSFGGNRWPRQETLALLKIRSEMDVAFRDASVKGPLWEQVSRKLGELGYHRSAKKCKEKFENVYKYHKRTKDVRSGKPDSKTYKFFEQLEALDTHPPHSQPLPFPLPPPSFHSHPPKSAAPISIPPQTTVISSHIPSTVPSTTTALPHLMNISFSQPNPTIHLQQPTPAASVSAAAAPPLSNPTNVISTPFQTNVSAMPTTTAAAVTFHNIEADLISNSTSSSSSTSSDEELEASRGRKRKRKWKDFFERLMREVIQKQEEMQRRFLEAIEKREHERVVREEAWRMQEMSKINKEREILAQERSMAAAKDAAITSFLQKITDGQHNNPSQQTLPRPPPPPPSQQQMDTPTPTPKQTPAPAPQPQPTPTPPQPVSTLQILVPQKVGNVNNEMQIDHNGGENYNMSPAASSSRWPKVEVQALIQLRTNLEAKYQENGPKGPLWEEISAAMKKIGYNRNAKRCKEKWENINKYFKKVKESKKTRREDSKTCPYFDLLDAIHKEKINKVDNNTIGSSRPLLLQHQQQQQHQQPLMVRPEQQWPPQQEITRPDSNEEMDRDDKDRDDDDDEDEDDDEEDEEEEDEGGGNYEIVASKPASVSAAE